ncbi:MAG: exo-beta-N-acetylmuramidase NamZ domain-containing protein [Flavobacteriales bacterium]
MMNMKSICFHVSMYLLLSCHGQQHTTVDTPSAAPITGAEQTELYLPLLQGKRVAVVANQTTTIGATHLVDSLIARGIRVVKVFAPEHGFRGEAGAGEHIADGKDAKTGLPLVSLYGKNKKPSPQMIEDVDAIVFDIQDVGARFYTYISTMHYVIEAAAEKRIEVVILDRPNPNGHYIDGPVLDLAYKSFVGMHPIPIVHGLTVGELAQMIVGEHWIEAFNGQEAMLHVIPCKHYDHTTRYHLPIRPSPNLATQRAIYLYPSLCWFEGTIVSVGRGTAAPFEIIGFPGNTVGDFHFTPKDIPQVAMDPPHEGVECTGLNLSLMPLEELAYADSIRVDWLVELHRSYSGQKPFFQSPDFFDKLCGTDRIRKMVEEGASAEAIRKSWADELHAYKVMRAKYLLYADFEQ